VKWYDLGESFSRVWYLLFTGRRLWRIPAIVIICTGDARALLLCYRKSTRLPVVCTKYLDGSMLLERTCSSLKVLPHPLSLRLYRFAPRPWFRRLRAGMFSLQTVHKPEPSTKCVFCYDYFSPKVTQCYLLLFWWAASLAPSLLGTRTRIVISRASNALH